MIAHTAQKYSKSEGLQVSKHYQNDLLRLEETLQEFDNEVSRYLLHEGNFAERPRRIKMTWQCHKPHEIALLGVLLNDLKQWHLLNGGSRFSSKYKFALDVVVANLLLCGRNRQQMLYSRRTSASEYHKIQNPRKLDSRMIMTCIDFLASQGYLAHHEIAVPKMGINSYCTPSKALIYCLEREKTRIKLAENAPLIQLRDHEKKPVTLPDDRESLREIERMAAPVRAYNLLWLKHEAKIEYLENGEPKERQVTPYLWRVFNHKLNLGGRWYGGDYQNIDRELRSAILIDNEQTVEPDYSAMHLNLLYSMKGLEMQGDPYTIEGYDRKAAKLACLILVNSKNYKAFMCMWNKSANPKLRAWLKSWKREYQSYLDDQRAGYHRERPEMPEVLKGIDESIPLNMRAKPLLRAFLERHSAIKDLFCTEHIGLKLQFMDSEILGEVVSRLAKLDIPVLPLHDSVRCRVSDEAIVKETMIKAFKDYTGTNPTVK